MISLLLSYIQYIVSLLPDPLKLFYFISDNFNHTSETHNKGWSIKTLILFEILYSNILSQQHQNFDILVPTTHN